MKQNSKQTEPSKKQKQQKRNIASIEADQADFKEDIKQSNSKYSGVKKKNNRVSQNLKKITMAYGGTQPHKQSKRNNTGGIQKKKEEPVYLTDFVQGGDMVNDQISTIKSMKSIQIHKLNNETYNTTQMSIDVLPMNEKFTAIEPRQIQIKSNREAGSPKNQKKQLPNQDKIKIKDYQTEKSSKPTKTDEKNVDKQKIKQIYNKIRSPNNKETNFTAETQSSQEIPAAKQNSRHKIQDQNEYISKITGRSKQKIQGKQQLNAQQILSGKVSIIWIFAFKSNIEQSVLDRINEMYNPLFDDDKAVPIVSTPEKIKEFVNIPNCYFKIVADLQCAQKAIGFRIYSKVIEFYIYNPKGNQTLLKALQFKNITRKVKGIFTDWDKILNRAQDQIEEEISIYKVNNGIQKRQRQRKFPNFLKLTDTDKTQATLYRINLYGSIKLMQQEKKQNLEHFISLIKSKYENKEQQKQNIQDYQKLDHLKLTTSLDQAREIIKFYVRQSFYYQILNSMLRTMKTSQEFKPCVLPFNQTYHSIRLYYENFLKQSNQEIPQMTLFRGCKLSKKDFNQLKLGVFVEMFGFMSTSKSQQRALDFVDRDGYLFVIHVKKRNANLEKFRNFDHGFVDINRYGLASSEYSKEEQVLFNALNVYRVKGIEEKDGYKYIHLEYGVIFDLLQKSKQQLTQDEYETLVNYHYCTKILGKIQDQGDVFLFANQLIEAKQYYDKKIKQGQNLAHNYYKLANVQKECGQIDAAEKNANQALKLFGEQIDLNDRQKCLKIFGIHSKNAEINLEKQDYLTADEQIDRAMSMLSDEQIFQRGVKLRQRGQVKFKKGQVKNAEKDFQQSEKIFQNIKDQGRIRKLNAYKHYYLSHLSLFCSPKTRNDLKKQLKEQLHKVNQMQKKISQVAQNIEDELVKINKSLKDVSLYVQDRQKYEMYVKKAQGYLYSLKARKANDPEIKAKLLAMQAMISDYQQLAQTEKLMNEAIRLIEQKNQFDLKVADYSKILAKMQKAELEKYTNPGKRQINERPQIPIPYDSIKRKQIYERCKQNFTKTLNILLYHAKDKASPQILDIRNQLGELTFGQNDYQQCQKIIEEARNGNENVIHSEMSKTLVIKAKICLARGQLKNSFETLKEAYHVLEESMVFRHQKQNQQKGLEKYKKLFQKSDAYLTIKLLKVTIYHKQKNHDMALKNIEQIKEIIVSKVGLEDSHPMLADVLQARGCSEVFMGNIYGFDEFFEKAITLREKQFGYYHPVNAKSYCAYAKFLIMVKDVKRAQIMLEKAVQIISAFEQTNPHYWAIYYSQGYYSEDKKQFDRSETFYEKSLEWANKYYNKSHISIKEVMLRYANSLSRSRKIQESIKIYEKLQEQLDEGIRDSNKRFELNDETDDEKISLKKLMYTQLCDLESQDSVKNQSYIETTHNNLINTSLYKSKLNFLRNTYNIPLDFDIKKVDQIND